MASKNTDVATWLMCHIREATDHTTSVKFSHMYEKYSIYCEIHKILVPATETCFSENLSKLFPAVTRDQGHRSKLYGIECMEEKETFQPGEVEYPYYCDVVVLQGSGTDTATSINVRTNHVIDGKTLCVNMKIEETILTLFVDGVKVAAQDLGMSEKFVLNQGNVNGLLNAIQNMVFCKGIDYQEEISGKTLIQQVWSTTFGESSSKRIKSRKCELVLPFTSRSIGLCRKCRDSINRYKMLSTNKENNNLVNDDTELKPSLDLSKKSHEDLFEILKEVAPNCTDGFKTLLQSQLNNFNTENVCQRKWDPAVISICLSMWVRSPQAYRDLRESGFLVLPSDSTLRLYKNNVKQTPGFKTQNLQWMVKEADRRKVPCRRGGLILDEMSIQDDLQVVKKGDEWTLVGACDLGELCNNIRTLRQRKKECSLASECLQFIFLGFQGFRWPVAYFPTSTAKAYELHILFWQAVDMLGRYGFTVDYVSVDGASTNRSLMKMHFSGDPRAQLYTIKDMYDPTHEITFVQDIKHTLKKIRNGLSSRKMEIGGSPVVWDNWVKAYEFNKSNGLRIHRKLTSEHVYLTPTSKMRNHLAMDVLDANMLYLMRVYATHVEHPETLAQTIALLENTSLLVTIFHDRNRAIVTMEDVRVKQLRDALNFFNQWEANAADKSLVLTQQTRDDLNSSVLGFLAMTERAIKNTITITPGYINSDIVENFFCQQRGLCNGMATNPTISQYGPAVNAVILGQSTISKKGNTSGQNAEPMCAKRAFPLLPARTNKCKKFRV